MRTNQLSLRQKAPPPSAHRRHARDVAAVGEGRAHGVVLAVDAENAAASGPRPTARPLGAAKDRIALGIDGLQEAGPAVAAGGEILAAFDAVNCRKMKLS